MLTQIILIVFLLAMAYWWALQGFFSALLHLVVAVLAGAIAMALWEPVVYGFLLPRMYEYAWGVGLLGPFILAFIVLRNGLDFLAKKNLHFMPVADMIGGGALGLIAGMFIAGVGVIGLSFLPMGLEMGGYQPYVVQANGKVEKVGSGLWPSVDHFAAGVLTRVTGGVFYAGHPMAEYRPELADAATRFRLSRQYDPNSSLVATPGSVTVDRMAVQRTPVPGLSDAVTKALGGLVKRPGAQLVTIETTWTAERGTFDEGTLYLPPVQMRLVTTQDEYGRTRVTVHDPIAYSRRGVNAVTLNPVNSDKVSARSSDQRQVIAWTYLVEANQQPAYLFARQLRLPLPEPVREPGAIVKMIGDPLPAADATATADAGQTPGVGEGEIGARDGGPAAGTQPIAVAVTNKLPKVISQNYAQRLRIQNNQIMSGRDDVPASVNVSRPLQVDTIWAPEHQRIARVAVDKDQAKSLLGTTRTLAASLGGVRLNDNVGNTWLPIGWVWLKTDGLQVINIDRDSPIRSAQELPTPDLAPGDELFLYFVVNPGTRLTQFSVGKTNFELNLPVE